MRESFIIEGLAGQKILKGSVKIAGAKNAALKAMAASILFDAPVQLNNIPDTEDIHVMSEILEKLGAKVVWSQNSLNIDTTGISSTVIDPKLAAIMRASVVLTGPILARFGKVSFPTPGGCVIGARPIDLFINGYEKMGATISETDFNYTIEMPQIGLLNNSTNGISGTSAIGGQSRSETDRTGLGNPSAIQIHFDKKTVGGTETLMMAAVLGGGTMTLMNCAMEPEIVNLAEWLNECGADIQGVGTETIMINGTGGKLLSPKMPYVAIPDRIEAGSYLILGALCAENMTIENCRPDHLALLIDMLIKSGVPIEIINHETSMSSIKSAGPSGQIFYGRIIITGNTKPNSTFKSFDVSTKEYPGFPTDLQAQIVTYLTQVTGGSIVTENIFEGRFKYVSDLQKMGAKLELIDAKEVSIVGPAELRKEHMDTHHQSNDGLDQHLNAHDIRAGFAIVMAALVGKGIFTVNNTYFIDRGYEKLEERLTALGANIRRVTL